MSTKVDTAGKELNWPIGNTFVISVTGQINKQLLQGPLYYIVGGMFSNQPNKTFVMLGQISWDIQILLLVFWTVYTNLCQHVLLVDCKVFPFLHLDPFLVQELHRKPKTDIKPLQWAWAFACVWVMLVYIKNHYGDLRKLIQTHIFLLREMVTFSRNRLSCNRRPLRIPLSQ